MGGRGSSSSTQIRTILGKKGKASDYESVQSAVNPNYNKGGEWQNNCQRCVYATEMRARGYNVEARPATMDGNDPMFKSYQWMHGFKDQKWEGSLGRTNKDVEKNIVSKMDGWGDGSRAIVYVLWKGGRYAHVFNVENKNGTVKIHDGQTGRTYGLNEYLSLSNPSQTRISRVDNLKTPIENTMKYSVRKVG